MMDLIRTLETADQRLTLAVNTLDTPVIDQFAIFFSKIPVWIPLYILVGVFMIRSLGWKKGGIVIASLLLTFLACDQFSNLIKHLVGRLRPCHDEWMIANGLDILEKKGGRFGFFSAHAANAFGFAVASWLGFLNIKKSGSPMCGKDMAQSGYRYLGYGIPMLVWASLVAISRVFVGKHYFGDIIVGTIIGICIGLIFGNLARLIIRRYIKD